MNEPMHVCLSGTPFCSGINPCDACHNVFVTIILPKAMVGGGFNGNKMQAAAFFQTYAAARREVLHNLAAQLQAQAPTLNAAEPEPEPEAPDAEQWQQGGPALTDEEVAKMAAPPPADFAPEPDEEPGMPDEDRAKEYAEALLKGESLTRKASPPPAGPDAAEDVSTEPRADETKEVVGEATAKE